MNYSLLSEDNARSGDDEKENNQKAPNEHSEVVHLTKTKTTLQVYLEQFAMENQQNGANSETSQTFDPTAELLKMLDEGKEN